MDFLKDFIRESKEKRIEEMSIGDAKSMLLNKKLDDFTVDLIAQKLGIDQNQNTVDGFRIAKKCENKFSDKQNKVRILAKQFMEGDRLFDTDNYMQYKYCENRGNNHVGFEGRASEMLLANAGKMSFDINIPETVAGVRIHSLEDAFRGTGIYTITINIEAKNISINDMFYESGVTNIPDFNKMDANEIDTWYAASDMDGPDGTWGYECINVRPRYLYDGLMSMKQITPETLSDFMVRNYNTSGLNQRLAQQIASRYFGIETEQPHISAEQIDKINKTLSLREKGSQTKEVLSHFTKLLTKSEKNLTGFDNYMVDSLLNRLHVSYTSIIMPMYLASLSPDDLKLSNTTVLVGEDKTAQIYKFETKDGITAYYNSETDKVEYRDNYDKSAERIEKAYKDYNFVEVSEEVKQQVLNTFAMKYSEIANDVFTNDATSVPVTSVDEKEIEEK